MSELGGAFSRLLTDLLALEAPFAVVGGLARIYYAGPRTTHDLDVAIAVGGDAEAEELIATLRQRFGYVVGETIEQEEVERLATQRLVVPGPTETSVDLLFASSGIEPEIVASAEDAELLEGLQAPIASLGHLVATKVLADRPKDRLDTVDLLKIASPRDLGLARAALDLIERRAFHRGKDLMKIYSDLLREAQAG